MTDFQLRVTAETQRAEKDLQRLDKTANTATKERKLNINVSELSKNFRNVEKNIKEAGNTIQTFYRVSKNIPGVGERVREFENLAKSTANIARTAPESAAALRENAKAGSILSNSFEAASAGAGRLVSNLAKAGFALFAIKEAVNVVQSAFSGFFNETIGREIKLRETILKTQTTLASTNKVFRNGAEITDPYEKIVALTGEVGKRIASIRERSIALAGVTSNEVIEVFGIVASQVGQIGGGLKEAEDLAINFAAALGTFGIPLYQARQEVGSILRGDITMDSYLAKSLGITNEDIAKAKSQAGGVIKFLEERLAASVAGQRIAAQGFAGVVSNIRDLSELVSQRFGAKLLNPLLSGLAAVFENLFRIREQIFSIVDGAGEFVARFAAMGKLLRERAGLISLGEIGLEDNSGQKALNDVKDAFQEIQVLISGAVQRSVGVLAGAISALKSAAMSIADAFVRLGKSFIEIKVSTFEALVRIVANLATAVSKAIEAFASLFNIYSRLLDLPVIQYFSEFAAQFALLKRLGMDAVTTLILVGTTITRIVIPAVGAVGVGIGVLLAAVGAVVVAVGKFALVVAGLATALSSLPTIAAGVAGALKKVGDEIGKSGQGAVQSGQKIDALSKGFNNLGQVAKVAGLNIIKSMGWTLLIQAGVTLAVDLFGRYQRAQEEATKTKRAELALSRLGSVYRNVGDEADYATKAARDFEAALAGAEYSRTVEELEKVLDRLKKLKDFDKKGTIAQKILQIFNLANLGAQQRPGETFSAAVIRAEETKRKKLIDFAQQYEKDQNKKTAEENTRLEADKRINLEKEIKEIRHRQENELFQQRQALAQKEVDIFRAAGELRIFQMEQANKKLIEGEEGASRSALEALNNYISVRERGELEIESAKKQLVIEVANLERQISDYRLENEKKIAEIRKRAGDYEQNVSNYRRQLAGQTAAGSGGGAATFGSTGNVNNAAGWVHGHFQTNNGTLNDLVADVIPVLKALLDQGIPVELSNGSRIASGKDDTYYRRMLTQAASQHRHSGDGRSLDLFVPAGTKVPVPLTNLTGNTGRGGITGGLPGTGKSWVGHLAPGSKAGSGTAITPPKAPSFTDIGAPAVGKYAEAVRSVASAMARLQLLQAQLTDAKTAAAFEEIAKAAFQPVGLESYQDQIYELDGVMKSLADGTYDAFNPERSQIAAQHAAKVLSSQRELAQIVAGINQKAKEGQLTEQQRKAAIDAVTLSHRKFVDSLRDEAQIRQQIQAITQITNLIKQIEDETARIERENEVIRLRNRLLIEGVDPAVIEQEVARLRRAQELSDAQKALNTLTERQTALQNDLNAARAAGDKTKVAQLEKELEEARKRIKELEEALKKAQEKSTQTKPETPIDQSKNPRDIIKDRIGNLKREIADLTNWGNIAVKAADGIGAAFSDAFKSVVSGASTVQEALGTMFQRIGDMFLQMATEIIAKMLIMYLLKSLIGIFGKGAAIGGTDAAGNIRPNMQAAKGASFSGGVAAFAGGGSFTNSIVKTATPFKFSDGGVNKLGVMGEAGPEAIMPLRRGSGGRLGVDAVGLREAMNSGPVSNGAPILNMSFETTSIGGTEYVSRDQLEAAMSETRRQASRDGAQRGMTMTLDRLQQSPRTRSRLGMR